VSGNLAKIQHVVVLMLENRSFDHMLGFLYPGKQTPGGQPFEGLTGSETNVDASGKTVKVFAIEPSQPNAYFMPGADPGEGYAHTNAQLFGAETAPAPPVATCSGFVTDYAATIPWDQENKRSVLAGTTANDILGVFPPSMLPILSGLAKGYAVCDHWFASVPTETMPNRAFVCAATSQGHMDDSSQTKSLTAPSIFGLLTKSNVAWSIYGYSEEPLTRSDFADTRDAPNTHFGKFADFQAAAKAGTLGAYTFLEPEWSSTGNSQHPNYDVALGEQLIHDVYYALRSNTAAWNATLFVIVYDEHGGLYDHVPPPQGATPPDATPGEYGFDFKRFGPRVPAVVVSPLVAAGTVFRAPAGATPYDHTSILKTVETRWNLAALTKRDAAAPDLGPVLTLSAPRTDDPIAGVQVPVSSGGVHSHADPPSELQKVHAKLLATLPLPEKHGGVHAPLALATSGEAAKYIHERTEAWKAHKR
jgi:phospholipase C